MIYLAFSTLPNRPDLDKLENFSSQHPKFLAFSSATLSHL